MNQKENSKRNLQTYFQNKYKINWLFLMYINNKCYTTELYRNVTSYPISSIPYVCNGVYE